MERVAKWISINGRYVRMLLDEHLKEFQINSSQHMYVLAICEQAGITQDQLAVMTKVNPSNVTRALTYLEKNGYIEKKISKHDKRTSQLYPTVKAQKMKAALELKLMQCEELLLKGFSEQEKTMFLQLNQRCVENLIEHMKERELDE